MNNTLETQTIDYARETFGWLDYQDLSQAERDDWHKVEVLFRQLNPQQQQALSEFLWDKCFGDNETVKDCFERCIQEFFNTWTKDPLSITHPSQNPNYKKFLLKPASEKPIKRIMVFVPHADDISYFAGGTLTHLKQKYGDSIEFDFVIATDNSAGFSDEMRSQFTHDQRVLVRMHEQMLEAKELGAASLAFLGYDDAGLEDSQQAARNDLVREIQMGKPEIIFTFAFEYGQKNNQHNLMSTNIEHLDHPIAGKIVMDAIKRSGMRAAVDPNERDIRTPHRPSSIYQFGYSGHIDPSTNVRMPLSGDELVQKLRALRHHRTQMQKYSQFSVEMNAFRYWLRVNRQIDKNEPELAEHFIRVEVPKL